MQYPNLFKRIIPFALALLLGLFVASFFVTLTPSFRGKEHMFRQTKAEYRDLKLENERLKTENEELRKSFPDCKDADYKNLDLYGEGEVPQLPPEWKKEKRLKKDLERLEKLK